MTIIHLLNMFFKKYINIGGVVHQKRMPLNNVSIVYNLFNNEKMNIDKENCILSCQNSICLDLYGVYQLHLMHLMGCITSVFVLFIKMSKLMMSSLPIKIDYRI